MNKTVLIIITRQGSQDLVGLISWVHSDPKPTFSRNSHLQETLRFVLAKPSFNSFLLQFSRHHKEGERTKVILYSYTHLKNGQFGGSKRDILHFSEVILMFVNQFSSLGSCHYYSLSSYSVFILNHLTLQLLGGTTMTPINQSISKTPLWRQPMPNI